MKRFELIEHTADIGLIASGRTLAEAFGNAAYGMFSIMTDMRRVRKAESRRIELQEATPESLLFEWLNYLIYLFDAERYLVKHCDFLEFDGTWLKADCYGEKIDPARHHMELGIKAATFYMLRVDSEKNEVRVIFDI